MSESPVGHISSKDNVTDLMTKILYGQKRRYLVSNILYDKHDNHLLSVLDDIRMQSGKHDPINNSMKLERTRKMQPFINPDI